jgi:putative transposase
MKSVSYTAEFKAEAVKQVISLKKERIKRQIYPTRDDAKSDVFDYIESFYNRVRRHSHLDLLSPLAFEQLRTGS